MTVTVGSYRGFGVQQLFVERLREGLDFSQEPSGALKDRTEGFLALAAQPFVGVTTDGAPVPDLYSLAKTGVSTQPIRDAALAYLASLDTAERQQASFAIDAPQWRHWFNGIGPRIRHGVLLHDLDDAQRKAALGLIQATLSPRGFDTVQKLMTLNRVLGEIIGEPELLNGLDYYLSLFGEPSLDQPWGWQMDGHHLNLHCFVLGDQVVLTPTFMGAEPSVVDEGPHTGLRAFDEERARGLALVQSLSGPQQDRAVLYRSILSKDLPPERRHPTEGRMRGGAFQDNLVMPYEGLRTDELSVDQRLRLVELIETFVGVLREGHDRVRMAEVERYLDQTHFAWIGAIDGATPFYYKIHSPVILVEFDHHKGIFLDNQEPELFHAHSVVRTPNGGDYGKDLLRQHLERFHAGPE